MNADRVVFRARLSLSTSFRSRSSMVIWIVFTAVDSDVGIDPHRIPHQGERRVGAYGLVTALVTPIHAGDLRESAMLRCASWCQLQRAPLGKWLNLLIMQIGRASCRERV